MATDNESNTYSDSIENGDLSKLLKEYRESANLSIEGISDALCLNPSAIEALENEQFDSLPESPYVRGYLRHYASLTGNNSEALIEIYNKLRGEQATAESAYNTNTSSYHDIEQPLITPQRAKLALLTGLLLLLGILSMVPAVRDWTSNLWTSFSTPSASGEQQASDMDGSSSLPSLTGDVPGNLPISEDNTDDPEEEATTNESTTSASTDDQNEQPISDNNTTDSQVKDTNTTEDSQEVAETKVDTPSSGSTTDAEETTSTENENTPETTGDTQLKLIFSEEVWIQIKDKSDKTVFEALHKAGTEKVLSLNSPLKLKIGNAPGMQLFVNGKEMDVSQFTKGSVAKFGIE